MKKILKLLGVSIKKLKQYKLDDMKQLTSSELPPKDTSSFSREMQLWTKFIDEIASHEIDMSTLTKLQKATAVVFRYYSEMSSGGYSGFFDVCTEISIEELTDALILIGGSRFVDNLHKAVDDGVNGYEETDNEYFTIEPSLNKLLLNFVLNHLNELGISEEEMVYLPPVLPPYSQSKIFDTESSIPRDLQLRDKFIEFFGLTKKEISKLLEIEKVVVRLYHYCAEMRFGGHHNFFDSYPEITLDELVDELTYYLETIGASSYVENLHKAAKGGISIYPEADKAFLNIRPHLLDLLYAYLMQHVSPSKPNLAQRSN